MKFLSFTCGSLLNWQTQEAANLVEAEIRISFFLPTARNFPASSINKWNPAGFRGVGTRGPFLSVLVHTCSVYSLGKATQATNNRHRASQWQDSKAAVSSFSPRYWNLLSTYICPAFRKRLSPYKATVTWSIHSQTGAMYSNIITWFILDLRGKHSGYKPIRFGDKTGSGVSCQSGKVLLLCSTPTMCFYFGLFWGKASREVYTVWWREKENRFLWMCQEAVDCDHRIRTVDGILASGFCVSRVSL